MGDESEYFDDFNQPFGSKAQNEIEGCMPIAATQISNLTSEPFPNLPTASGNQKETQKDEQTFIQQSSYNVNNIPSSVDPLFNFGEAIGDSHSSGVASSSTSLSLPFSQTPVIPITQSDDKDEIIYFVGLQVDLVDQPNAISEKMKNGTYVVDYSLLNMPAYIPPSVENIGDPNVDYFYDVSSSMPFSASSEIFDLIGGSTDAETVKRSWNRMLLEHSVDFVHVLSLKGLFLYCSVSCRRILEYDPDELVGRNLSTFCHPSDIVYVMRELKESSSGAEDVTLAYRIRRKNSGYMWIEAHGKLHSEKGKGRKCVILSARERPVYKLQQKYLQISDDTHKYEFWSKLSADGLFLYVSSVCQNLLGLSAEELVGVSLYNHVKPEHATDISRALVQANNGIPNSLNRQIQKKNGQYIEVLLTFYPGDSGQTNNKPSFIICQIKEAIPELGKRQSLLSSQPFLTSASSSDSVETGERANENIFEELSTTKGTSWQYELHQMRSANKKLRAELEAVKNSKKKRKKRIVSSSNK
ncbi:4923_t:CDS:2, partial [Acaulospora colombiana]